MNKYLLQTCAPNPSFYSNKIPNKVQHKIICMKTSHYWTVGKTTWYISSQEQVTKTTHFPTRRIQKYFINTNNSTTPLTLVFKFEKSNKVSEINNVDKLQFYNFMVRRLDKVMFVMNFHIGLIHFFRNNMVQFPSFCAYRVPYFLFSFIITSFLASYKSLFAYLNILQSTKINL